MAASLLIADTRTRKPSGFFAPVCFAFPVLLLQSKRRISQFSLAGLYAEIQHPKGEYREPTISGD